MSQKTFMPVIFFCIFNLIFSSLCLGEEPLKIGESFDSSATAQNNSRKIVRTATDRRIVVYQNVLENRPVIQWVYSDDGFNWSEPAILGYGRSPSLTIAENDWIYAVWCSEDEKGICFTYLKDNSTNWEGAPEPIMFLPSDAIACRYPSIETTLNRVHVVWQGTREADATADIFYQQFARDFSWLTPPTILSSDSCDAKMPILAGDLEFAVDWLHIFWTDFSVTQNKSYIVYRNSAVTNENDIILSPPQILPFINAAYPSVSVRNYLYDTDQKGSDIVISYVNETRDGFCTSLMLVNSSELNFFHGATIRTNLNPLPVVDDAFFMSCAIVWQADQKIFYGQNKDGQFITLPPIPINSTSDKLQLNPNICYKTFRQNYFDVIWTEGNEPPFDIMYRRMEKRYEPMFVPAFRQTAHEKDFQLLQNYPNPFNNATNIPINIFRETQIEINIFNIDGRLVRKLASKNFPQGSLTISWDGKDNFHHSLSTGIYFVKVVSESYVSTEKIILVR